MAHQEEENQKVCFSQAFFLKNKRLSALKHNFMKIKMGYRQVTHFKILNIKNAKS